MIKVFKNYNFMVILNDLLLFLNRAVPDFIKIRTDPEKFGITKFMEFASKEIKPSDRVLDAGAGQCPYKDLFLHAKYESTDFQIVFDNPRKANHSFICSLDNIPISDNSYDAIVSTQVLEHVEDPLKVVKEFYRIMKFGGKLFLTAPQGWGVHGEPYNFFYFTKYGLESLFRKGGFHIISLSPRGGIFWDLAKRIRTLPYYILYQYLYEKNGEDLIRRKTKAIAFLLFPFYLVTVPFFVLLIPLLFFYLDKLDKKQDFTLGYACCCEKMPESQ